MVKDIKDLDGDPVTEGPKSFLISQEDYDSYGDLLDGAKANGLRVEFTKRLAEDKTHPILSFNPSAIKKDLLALEGTRITASIWSIKGARLQPTWTSQLNLAYWATLPGGTKIEIAQSDLPEPPTVSWTTSNESLVSVNDTGLAKAVAVGGPVSVSAIIKVGEETISVQPLNITVYSKIVS
ncbi:MAG: hypothetical protein Q4E37_04310 [Tissierellia bacterium]|nr:hypothetical protein [Tissierellia bacterium]